jgi:hypothetical protein
MLVDINLQIYEINSQQVFRRQIYINHNYKYLFFLKYFQIDKNSIFLFVV